MGVCAGLARKARDAKQLHCCRDVRERRRALERRWLSRRRDEVGREALARLANPTELLRARLSE